MSPRTLQGPVFITTSPDLTGCRHCGRPVLAATVDGLDTHIDPTALTPVGELAALLAGASTYDLRGQLLAWRSAVRIRAGHTHPVLAEHTCRPPDPSHVHSGHLEVVVALIQRLTGGQPVVDLNQPAPF